MQPNDTGTQRITVDNTHRDLSATLVKKAKAIQLMILDVDGVLTDGGIIYGNDGEELKRFHARDGVGIRVWQSLGLNVGLLSGRNSQAVIRRSKELNLGPVLLGRADKKAALQECLVQWKLSAEQVCVMGDDLPDLPIAKMAGISIAVADACPEVRLATTHVTALPGGQGAVREAIEWLLTLRGEWVHASQNLTQPG